MCNWPGKKEEVVIYEGNRSQEPSGDIAEYETVHRLATKVATVTKTEWGKSDHIPAEFEASLPCGCKVRWYQKTPSGFAYQRTARCVA